MNRNGADAILHVKAPLKDQSDIEIITEKDYISHPKPNGYRSLHLTYFQKRSFAFSISGLLQNESFATVPFLDKV